MVREKDGKIFLVDFGLARVIETEKELTKMAVGTEGYIPPEQYAGKPVPASDIYSLGVTLHHMVTGEFPFVPFIFKPIRNFNSNLSLELEAIIEKCINLKLEERYSSALTLKRDLMLVKTYLTSTKLNKSEQVRPEKPKFTRILKPEQKKYSIPLEITERVAALESDVAQKMLRSIETLSRSNVLPYLIQMMHNKDVEVRRAVATALGGLKDSNAVGYLIELLRDTDSHVRQLAAWGLGESKDKRSLHPLMEALMTGDAELRGGAALALGELKDREAVMPLIDVFLTDEDPMVRKRAARALGETGDKSALIPLINSLEKEVKEPLKQTISWSIKQLQ
jgi:HEAT repeat protein